MNKASLLMIGAAIFALVGARVMNEATTEEWTNIGDKMYDKLLKAGIDISDDRSKNKLPEVNGGSATKTFGDILSEKQKSNVKALLKACSDYTFDEAQLAYVLSTAWGESGFMPIKEKLTESNMKKYGHTGFYGRGYVQLTWDHNYIKFGKLLGIPLFEKPDLALTPDVAGKIICLGMFDGKFTHSKRPISYYISNSKRGLEDFKEARRLINSLDKATKFAQRAIRILDAGAAAV
jgi:putative chitinase